MPAAPPTEQRFATRAGLLLSVLGIAVGTGNVWRFPRIVAQNGGEDGAGAFLVVWLVFLLLWSIPLIAAEYALGRMGRLGIVGTAARLCGPRCAALGTFVGIVATAIMFYYSVVTGWCMSWATMAVAGELPATPAEARATWDQFQSGLLPYWAHAAAMVLACVTVGMGVGVIERVSKIMLPALLVVIVLAAVRAATLPGASAGLSYLFTPTWSDLARPELWLQALTQNAWDTGAGWGLILTYSAYMRSRDSVIASAVATGVGNNTVSMLAAITIFATVFSTLGAELDRGEVIAILRDTGPASTGLTFLWMPPLFAEMAFGRALAVVYFVGLSLAALTSLMSMVELAVRVLIDVGLSRRSATVAIGLVGTTLGMPSAASLEFFDNQDFVWGVGLLISGLLIAVMVRTCGIERVAAALDARSPITRRLWSQALGVLIPVQGLLLLGFWLRLSATIYDPERWWDPRATYSVTTCLVQWAAAAGLALAVTPWLVRRMRHGADDSDARSRPI